MARKSRFRKQSVQPPNLAPWWAIAILCVLGGVAAVLVGVALATD